MHMAYPASFTKEDFSCVVCRDVFKHPVILLCSHSFCKSCLQDWWTRQGKRKCPVCEKTNKGKNPPFNLALNNLCQAFEYKSVYPEEPPLLKEDDDDDDKEKEDLSCPVCWDIFKHPVILLCSHSFCKACVLECWKQKGKQVCPVCKKPNKVESPPCNLALKNLCETFVQEKRPKRDPDEATTNPTELCVTKEDNTNAVVIDADGEGSSDSDDDESLEEEDESGEEEDEEEEEEEDEEDEDTEDDDLEVIEFARLL